MTVETKLRREKYYRLKVGAVVFALFVLAIGGVFWRAGVKVMQYYQLQHNTFIEAQQKLDDLYSDVEGEVPRKDLQKSDIEVVENDWSSIRLAQYKEEKARAQGKIQELQAFVVLQEEIDGLWKDRVVKAEINSTDLEELKVGMANLAESYRGVLQEDYDEVVRQYQAIVGLREAVAALFTDVEMNTVVSGLKRVTYNEVLEQFNKLPQREIAEQYTEVLANVDKILTQREKEAAEAYQRAVLARRRAEELRRQQQQEEAAAWRLLNVPYHSQNLQQIYNGCEAASMLMGLQYKGYLSGVNLHQYAEMMPKSDDYNTGFVGSIYDLQPKTYVHWIAPAPLAKFGRESSGNQNVIDMTGASLADLDREILAGNPVVIYVTFLFNPLKEWLNGAPKNLHVVLLTGYNEKTGAHRLTDPWTQSNGGRTYDLSSAELEKLYNAVGKRAVVIR